MTRFLASPWLIFLHFKNAQESIRHLIFLRGFLSRFVGRKKDPLWLCNASFFHCMYKKQPWISPLRFHIIFWVNTFQLSWVSWDYQMDFLGSLKLLTLPLMRSNFCLCNELIKSFFLKRWVFWISGIEAKENQIKYRVLPRKIKIKLTVFF